MGSGEWVLLLEMKWGMCCLHCVIVARLMVQCCLANEANAVRVGLKTAIEAGFNRFIVEVGNLTLFYALSKQEVEMSSYGMILRDIWPYVSMFPLPLFVGVGIWQLTL